MAVEKRGNKWRARLRLNGQPPMSRTFNDKRAAEAWEREMTDAAKGGKLGEVVAAEITLGEVARVYSDKVTGTKRGAMQEISRVECLRASSLGKLRLSAITRKVLRDWRDRRLQQVTGSSFNRELSLVSVVLKYAKHEMDCAVDLSVVQGLRQAENAARTGRISREVEAKLVAIEPWIALAIATGARRGELFALRHDDIDRQQMLLRIRGTKTAGSLRAVPISAATLALIDRLPRHLTDERVLWSVPSAARLSQRFAAAAAAIGEPDLVLHLCRHEAVSRLAERGASIPLLRSFSGHATLAMLARYARPDSDGLRQMVA